jgi:hypothetical protein
MKILTTIFSICFVGCLSAQQNQAKSIKKNVVLINNAAVLPISGTSTHLQSTDTSAIKSRIAAIDSHIKAIDIKVSYVSGDQEQRDRAKKIGWFDQMEKNRKELSLEKLKLEDMLKSKP